MIRLPQEILDIVFQYLPIPDIAAVLRAGFKPSDYRGRPSEASNVQGSGDVRILERSVSNRIDPAVHFRKGFINVKQMVECMSRTGTALIGPRAFEYFSGDVGAGHDDTWDFLAQWFPAEVLDMLIALSRAGVTWETPLERAARQYRDCGECQEAMRENAIEAAAVERTPPSIDFMLQKFSECRSHERHGILTSVRGTGRDGKTPVVLHIQELNNEIVDNAITAPFRHLCDVRLGHLQCMVTGYAAVHMNFTALKDNETFVLHQGSDEPVDQSLIPAGYHIGRRHEAHGALRALADGGSLCMDLSRFSRIDREIAAAAHRVINFAVWYEYHNMTVHLPSLIDCASAGRVSPFIRYIWGDRIEYDTEILVGKSNHSFNASESLVVLGSEYGLVNDWI